MQRVIRANTLRGRIHAHPGPTAVPGQAVAQQVQRSHAVCTDPPQMPLTVTCEVVAVKRLHLVACAADGLAAAQGPKPCMKNSVSLRQSLAAYRIYVTLQQPAWLLHMQCHHYQSILVKVLQPVLRNSAAAGLPACAAYH